MNEWNYSGTIAIVDPGTVHIDDFLFHFFGKWYSYAECLKWFDQIANTVAEALRGFIEEIVHLISKYLPEIIKVVEKALKEHKRKKWLPVRYIGVNDRRTDRRPQVHCIRNALPNMHKDRRMKRKGD